MIDEIIRFYSFVAGYTDEITGYSAIVAGFTVAVLSLYYAHRHQKFQWSFVFLGIAYFSYGTAEYLYYRLETVDLEAYGSIADLAYVWYFLFSVLHVFVMLTYFQKCGIRTIVTISTGSVLLGSVYVIMSLGSEYFLYGLFFSAWASLLGMTAIVTTYRLVRTKLKKSWIFIGVAIAVSSLTDIWYYTQENLTGYEYGQFPLMDCLWFATDVLIIIAILLHRQEI